VEDPNRLAVMPARCFFLDANIVISQILNENDPRISKLMEDSKSQKIPCYISQTVKLEVANKVSRTTDYLGNTIRQTIKTALEDQRTRRNIPLDAPMDYEDVNALEDLFSVCHASARRQGAGQGGCLVGPLTAIEEWSVKFIAQKLNNGDSFTIDDFILELTKVLLSTTSTIRDVFEYLVEFERGHIKIKTVNIDPQVRRVANIAEGYGIHHPDSLHIACAYYYELINHELSVFTTQDYGVINHRPDLLTHRIYARISDPLYALYHF
jgi:predicted nucleic acid-binding protein